MHTLLHNNSGVNSDGETCKGWKQRDRIRNADLSGIEKSVLRELLDHANGDHFQATGERVCFLDQRDLERYTGFCQTSVKRALKNLVAQGLVAVDRQRGYDGRLGRNRYTIKIEKLPELERARPVRARSPETKSREPEARDDYGPETRDDHGHEGDQRRETPLYNTVCLDIDNNKQEPVLLSSLERDLAALGIAEWKAADLVKRYDHDILQAIAAFPWRDHPEIKNPPGHVVRALERGYDWRPREQRYENAERVYAKL